MCREELSVSDALLFETTSRLRTETLTNLTVLTPPANVMENLNPHDEKPAAMQHVQQGFRRIMMVSL